jgi:molybdopterin biosynthesis enzyme
MMGYYQRLPMKLLKVEDAVGQTLCHDMTRIVKGEMKGVQFRKGHIIREEDIPMLLSMGKERIYVWEKPEGFLHEDEAAEVLAGICRGNGIGRKGPAEGKIELFAQSDGLFQYNQDTLNRLNEIEDVIISARHNRDPVKAGDKLAAMKVVPLAVEEDKLRRARTIAGEAPVFSILPYTLKSAAIIITGGEVAKGLVTDAFGPVLKEKLASYGIAVVKETITADGIGPVSQAIAEARREKPELILCSGGMSVDPDDHTPGAIGQSGAKVVIYGTPVLPGAMFLLAYFDDGIPIMGIPGCVMSARATVFDLVLPSVAAGLRLERRDLTRRGAGGLCLSCPQCHYPVCPFGK